MCISLYIHIPFCVSKCHYCDFNSTGIGQNHPPERSYIQDLKYELQRWSRSLWKSTANVSTVFFGGGTPSLFSSEGIGDILQTLRFQYSIQQDAEISLEMNPKTADLAKMKRYLEHGVNRLSLGVQSLDPSLLKELGRAHGRQDALQALAWAFETDFPQISLDLMYGLSSQTTSQLEETLQSLDGFPLRHLSAYQLIVEEGTPFFDKFERGNLLLPETEEVLEMEAALAAFAQGKGMAPYEISNWAASGHEARHNLHYWNYDSFVGLGAGAVSFLRVEELGEGFWREIGLRSTEDLYGIRLTNPYSLKVYSESSSSWKNVQLEPISKKMAQGEFMMMGLRKRAGISFSEYEKKFGVPFPSPYQEILEKFQRRGWMEADGKGCRLSEAGIPLSNEVLQEFISLH